MERIQRALELSRLQRAVLAEVPARAAPLHDEVEAQIEFEVKHARADPPGTAQRAPLRSTVQRFAVDRPALRARRVVLSNESSAAARAYRMLRAQVLQRCRASGMRSLGIVSAANGEGKTLTAVNLAISLAAEPNQSVCLVDLDLRRPAVAATLGIAPAYGLESWLSTEAEPEALTVCELDDLPRLTVVPTLAPVPGSSEVLAGPRIRSLIKELKTASDSSFLIIDLPPALLSDDVLTLAPLLDGFMMVITEGRTRRDDVDRVLELLGRERMVGTVLNGSSASEQRAY
jgi:Mrp family chromosome partitioning ATPase